MHGGRIGFVFQDPGTSLNPLLTLERQITESLEAHRHPTRREAQRPGAGTPRGGRAARTRRTGCGSYPHQLSGGQRQRVMIAIALACDPELLIADEPTTSLDVTTQAQIIDLVRDLQRDFGTAVVWISHDLGVIGQVADDVTVLHDGEVVEQAPVLDVFDRPQQPYTRELLEARPLVGWRRARRRSPTTPRSLLEVAGLDVRFPVDDPGRQVDRPRGARTCRSGFVGASTLGLVGESGFGQVDGRRRADGAGATRRRDRATLDGADVLAVGAARPRRRCGDASAWCCRIRSRR